MWLFSFGLKAGETIGDFVVQNEFEGFNSTGNLFGGTMGGDFIELDSISSAPAVN